MWRLRRVPGLEAALFAARCTEIERGERILERMKDPLMQELCEGERATIKLG
jgi:hypothetical protein